MSGTEPIGSEGWDALLCRLAELAGARPALTAELVDRIYGAGWDAALVYGAPEGEGPVTRGEPAGHWRDARDDPAYVAGWDRCMEQVLAILDDLRPTNPAWPVEMRVDWEDALDAVRARLAQLQAQV